MTNMMPSAARVARLEEYLEGARAELVALRSAFVVDLYEVAECERDYASLIAMWNEEVEGVPYTLAAVEQIAKHLRESARVAA